MIDYVLNDLKFDGKYRRERIVVGCLGWLAQLKDENGFDVPFCEVLFAAGELKVLHSYAVERYMAIYDVRFCTGMIPLAKKLFKAGDPLAACIFMRGAIYYLMGMGNSRYCNDVHAHRRTLAEMAASVKDWENVEPQSSFDSDFAADFANRRTFWF